MILIIYIVILLRVGYIVGFDIDYLVKISYKLVLLLYVYEESRVL